MFDFGKKLHYMLGLGYSRSKYVGPTVLQTYFSLNANSFIGSI